MVEYASTGSSRKRLVSSNPDNPAWVGDQLSPGLSIHAIFLGGALMILSLDCPPVVTVLHLTCLTGVEGPAFAIFDFPMLSPDAKLTKWVTFDSTIPPCHTLNMNNFIRLGSSVDTLLHLDTDQVHITLYQVWITILRLAHKRCQNQP